MERSSGSAAPAAASPPPLRTRTRLFALSSLALAIALVAALLSPSASLLSPATSRSASAGTRSAHYAMQLCADPPPRTLRVGSLNIRYDMHARHPERRVARLFATLVSPGKKGKGREGEGEERYGEEVWQDRREPLVDLVRWEQLDVLGVQEALHHQQLDLAALLGEDEWGHVGVGALSPLLPLLLSI